MTFWIKILQIKVWIRIIPNYSRIFPQIIPELFHKLFIIFHIIPTYPDQGQNKKNKKNKKVKKEVQTLSVDFDALLPHIGEMGRYQMILYLLMCIPATLPAAFLAFNQVQSTFSSSFFSNFFPNKSK
jgi:hypothetical protein